MPLGYCILFFLQENVDLFAISISRLCLSALVGAFRYGRTEWRSVWKKGLFTWDATLSIQPFKLFKALSGVTTGSKLSLARPAITLFCFFTSLCSLNYMILIPIHLFLYWISGHCRFGLPSCLCEFMRKLWYSPNSLLFKQWDRTTEKAPEHNHEFCRVAFVFFKWFFKKITKIPHGRFGSLVETCWPLLIWATMRTCLYSAFITQEPLQELNLTTVKFSLSKIILF